MFFFRLHRSNVFAELTRILYCRENPNDRSAKDVQHLGPATDFYKRLALECSGQQIAVDVFLLNSQYSDLATICKCL